VEKGPIGVVLKPIDPLDSATVAAQLGRSARGMVAVAWRCRLGYPGVVLSAPRLEDGTPFPTTYYLTCPAAVKACSTLEGSGLMTEMTARLAADRSLAAAYRAAHDSYLADRTALAAELGLSVPELAGVSAGGMPDRVKCLHALVGQALAKGPGVNPFGDEALTLVSGAKGDGDASREHNKFTCYAEAKETVDERSEEHGSVCGAKGDGSVWGPLGTDLSEDLPALEVGPSLLAPIENRPLWSQAGCRFEEVCGAGRGC
jgi:hypothetical protein